MDDGKTPCYEGTLQTYQKETFIFSADFPVEKDLREQLYGKWQKELQLDGKKENATEETNLKFNGAPIGDKSFGIVDKDKNVCKLIFQRGIMVFKLENQKGKDTKELASEIDKQWQKTKEQK